jgi:glutaconyl-CoA decarboxylase
LRDRCVPFGNTPYYFYSDKSRPASCANHGFVDEVVSFPDLRKYLVAFAGCVYQNPKSMCAQHQMILPRIIKG